MKKTILIATTNQGKADELISLLGAVDAEIKWLSMTDFPEIDEVVEDGKTFAENARKKATGYAKATGCWTIADDSGLAINALDEAPGVMSARFSEPSPDHTDDRRATDRRNMDKVLRLLKTTPPGQRTARFVCNLCLANPQGVLAQTEGTLPGTIAQHPKGTNGFGYDPIFLIPKLNCTAAELTSREKNALSHRGEAIKKLRPLLASLLSS